MKYSYLYLQLIITIKVNEIKPTKSNGPVIVPL